MPDTVAAYRGRYEALKGRLDGKRDAAIGKAVGVYRGELELLLTNVRQQGKLDYVVAIQGELKRLETDPTAPKKPAARSMMHLRRAQGGARVAEDQALEAHGKGLAELRKGYSSSRRSLEKRLVAANEIEEAKLARAERAKIPKPVKKGKAEPREKPKEKPVPRLARKPVTTTVEAWVDGETELILSKRGLQWDCHPRIAVVGKRDRRKPAATLVNGKKWHPTWTKDKRGRRMSDVYRVKGLGRVASITVMAKRAGVEIQTVTGPVIGIPDPQTGAAWYVITITHGERPPLGQGR